MVPSTLFGKLFPVRAMGFSELTGQPKTGRKVVAHGRSRYNQTGCGPSLSRGLLGHAEGQEAGVAQRQAVRRITADRARRSAECPTEEPAVSISGGMSLSIC
jgi:hypothetical protein